MGTYGNKILGIDVNDLVEKLNKALADEWLAYYQYWVGAKVIKGCNSEAIIPELLEHAQDELRHAEMLSNRILQLGGTPILDPKEWFTKTGCGYKAPTDFAGKAILDQNIKSEQCAIEAYKEIMDYVEGKDHITYQMVLEIFKDEIEHEDDLEKLSEDSCSCS